jgi:2-C-methyl-D-erythritol 4-phosphate cytidylyltransferase / 2-C-methyl-D-erythritol 2,4-cyclodiphosphate synthase
MIRVGSGLDVHAFVGGVPLWLGGVLVPHFRGLAGHSDGDAAVHALIDALLGAAGDADIGEWFPAGDPRWQGARSTDLLRHVWLSLQADGWRLENTDLTIVASEPRLAPFRLQMRQAIATALDCAVDRVSVKATTSDGLGALGRAEGVLACAVALLSRPDPPPEPG